MLFHHVCYGVPSWAELLLRSQVTANPNKVNRNQKI